MTTTKQQQQHNNKKTTTTTTTPRGREDWLGKANAARAQVLEPQQQLPGLPSSEQFPTGELKLNNNTNNNYKNYNNNRDSQS